jgi:hypothetical protein
MLIQGPEPRTFNEAIARQDGDRYFEAAVEEMENHRRNETWVIGKAPPGSLILDRLWLFDRKPAPDGSIERYKARLVVQGQKARPGIDFTDKFSPTIKIASFRLVCALAAKHGMLLHSIDITSAYLNGVLEEPIYMRQPSGFHTGDKDDVCILQKAIYGLPQAGRQWNKKLHSVLKDMGFTRLESDRSLYIFTKGEVQVIVPVYVDDITLASTSQAEIDHTIQELQKRFKLRNLGPTNWILGMEVHNDPANGTLSLSQRRYTLEILEEFGMLGCNPVKTPFISRQHLDSSMCPSTTEEKEIMSKRPYLRGVGKVLYLANTTRPDIAWVVGKLARFGANPGTKHWDAFKHLLRYLQGTVNFRLTYRKNLDIEHPFITFSDADHGGDQDNGRSTGGYMVRCAGGAISWSSRLQPIVTLSTTESEYIASVEGGKEICWTRNLLHELGSPVTKSSPLMIDNASSVQVAKNPEHHGRMKQLNLCYFWLRDVVDQGIITPIHLPSTENPADLLTKPLDASKLSILIPMFGLENVPPG